jgi:hypothetical protein
MVKTRYETNESSREVAAAISVEEVVVVAATTQGNHMEEAMVGKTKGGVHWKTSGLLMVVAAYSGDQAVVLLYLEVKLPCY